VPQRLTLQADEKPARIISRACGCTQGIRILLLSKVTSFLYFFSPSEMQARPLATPSIFSVPFPLWFFDEVDCPSVPPFLSGKGARGTGRRAVASRTIFPLDLEKSPLAVFFKVKREDDFELPIRRPNLPIPVSLETGTSTKNLRPLARPRASACERVFTNLLGSSACNSVNDHRIVEYDLK
jgi:hypothetical protein